MFLERPVRTELNKTIFNVNGLRVLRNSGEELIWIKECFLLCWFSGVYWKF